MVIFCVFLLLSSLMLKYLCKIFKLPFKQNFVVSLGFDKKIKIKTSQLEESNTQIYSHWEPNLIFNSQEYPHKLGDVVAFTKCVE